LTSAIAGSIIEIGSYVKVNWMKIRQVLGLRASHIEEQSLARAERLKEAIQFAKLLGYKRISWVTLERLGYNTKELRCGSAER